MAKSIEKPLSLQELRAMQQAKGAVTAVIAVAWDDTGDIESLNDIASEQLTGSSIGLEGISYRLVGVDAEAQKVLLEVTGTAENWLAEQEED